MSLSAIKRRLVAAAALLVAGGALGLVLLHTSPVRRYVLGALSGYLKQHHAIELRAGELSYNLVAGTAALRDVSLSAAAGLPPLLTANQITVDIAVSSLVLGPPRIEQARLEAAQLRLVTDEGGNSNLPAGSDAGEAAGPPAVVIDRLDADGLFAWEDRAQRLAVQLPAWTLAVRAGDVTGEHNVAFRLAHAGWLEAAGQRLAIAELAADCQLGPAGARLHDLLIRSEAGRISAKGSVSSWSRPQFDVVVEADFQLEQLTRMAGMPDRIGGAVQLRASVLDTWPDLRLVARLGAENLRLGAVRPVRLEAAGEWTRAANRVVIENFSARSPAGAVTARAVADLAGESRLDAQIYGLDSRAVLRSLKLPPWVATKTSARVDVRWTGLDFDSATGAIEARFVPLPSAGSPSLPVAGSLFVTAKGEAVLVRIDSTGIPGLELNGELELSERRADGALSGRLAANSPSIAELLSGLDLKTGLEGSVRADSMIGGSLERPQADVRIGGADLAIGTVRGAVLEARAQFSPEVIRLEEARLGWQGQSLTARGSVGLDGASPSLNLQARIEEASVETILSGLGSDLPVAGVLGMEATVDGAADDPRLRWSVTGSGLSAYGEPLGTVAAGGGFAGGVFQLDRLLLDQHANGGGRLEARGRYDVASGDYAVTADGEQLRLTGALPGAPRAEFNASLSGEGNVADPALRVSLSWRGLEAQGRSLGAGRFQGAVENHAATLDLEAPDLGITGEARAETRAPYQASVQLRASDTDLSKFGILLPGGDLLQGKVSLRVDASGSPESVREARLEAAVDELHLAAGAARVDNDGPVRIAYRDEQFVVDQARLKGMNSELSLEGWLPWAAGKSGSFSVRGRFDVASLVAAIPATGPVSAGGQFTLDGNIAGSLMEPRPSAVLRLEEGSWKTPALRAALSEASIEAALEEDSLALRRMTAKFGDATLRASASAPWSFLPFDVPWREKPGPPAARFDFQATNLEAGSAVALPENLGVTTSFRIEGQATEPELEAMSARIHVDDLRVRLAQLLLTQPAPARLSVDNGRLRVDRLALTGPDTRIEAAGTAGLTGEQPLDLQANGNFDLALLSAFAEGIRPAGECRFQVNASGTLADPALAGFVEIPRGQLAVPGAGLFAENLGIRLRLDQREMRVDRFEGDLNGGTVRVAGGVAYSGAELETANLNLTAKNLFLEIPAGFQSLADSDLSVRTVEDRIVISGNVEIQEGSYSEPLDIESQLLSYLQSGGAAVDLIQERDPMLGRLRFDVRLRTRQPVEMRNNLGELAASLDLRLTGGYYRPGVVGRIVTEEGGTLRLRQNKFVVERGIVSFLNESRIEPALDLAAHTEVKGRNITLQVSGDQRDLQTNLTSDDPDDSQGDILSLLVTGKKLEDVRGEEMHVVGDQALWLLSGAVSGRLTRGIQETLGLSRVRIDPQLISAESDPTARLTIGQDITDDLELTYSMNLADSRDQIWIARYDLARRFSTSTIKDPGNNYRFEFRHALRFGEERRQGPDKAAAARKIGNILFSGSPGFPENTLLGRLKLKPGAPYDFFKIRRNVGRLDEFYADRNRLEARIRMDRQTQAGRVDLGFRVEAGPEVRFVYEGWEPPGSVKEQVRDIWKRGVFDSQRVQECRRALRAWLALHRYLEPEISDSVRENLPGQKLVLFTVTPGTRFQRVETEFAGASAIAPEELRSKLEAANLQTDLHLDPDRVARFFEDLYGGEGYFDVKVAAPRYELNREARSAKIVVRVEEGPRFVIGSVTFSGNSAIPEAELAKAAGLAGGAAYTSAARQDAITAIEEVYWRRGYNNLIVHHALSRSPDRNAVDVAFTIEENEQQTVSEISVEGNRHTSAEFIRRQLAISPADILDHTLTARSRRNLYNTGAYSFVEITSEPDEQPALPGRRHLLVRVQERTPYALRYGGFFDTDKGPGVIADFTTRNTLGGARVFGVRTRYDGDIRELRGYFSQPFLKHLPLNNNVASFLRREIREAFITDRIGFSVQQQAQLRNRFLLSYGYRWESAHTFDRVPDPILPFDETLRIAPLTASLTRDTRDEILDAVRGSFTSHAVEFATSTLGSDLRFLKYFGQYFHYMPLASPVSLPFSDGRDKPRLLWAAGVRAGLAKGLGGQTVIPSERFFAGGGTTIRGFQQDRVGPVDFFGRPRGGDAVFIANNELRFPAFSLLEGVAFVDVGNVFRNLGDFDPLDLRKTGGLGVRVRTPYFLLRLDYGFKLDRKPGEGRGALFFSIGQAF